MCGEELVGDDDERLEALSIPLDLCESSHCDFCCLHTSVIPTALDLEGGGFVIVMRAMEKEITKMVRII